MGNYISCTMTIQSSPSMKSSRASRVIFPTGEIRQFSDPIKAAEIMLESPTFFLVNSRSLHINRRFNPLSADEDLEFGQVYIMFGMKRLNSIVTASDMAVLFLAANSAAKKISGGNVNRISPENEETAAVETVVVEGFEAAECKYKFAACRSKRPMLETINEETVCFR